MKFHWLAVVFHVLCVVAFGQSDKKPATPPAVSAPAIPMPASTPPALPAATVMPTKSPSGVVSRSQDPTYPFPPEDRYRAREIEYRIDQKAIQRTKLEGEENVLWEQLKQIAFEAAKKQNIDLTIFEVDPVELQFVMKRK